MMLTMIMLVSCGGSKESYLIGRWSIDENYHSSLEELEFFSDGTYVSDHPNYEGNYSVDNDRIRLTGILVDSKTYTFDVNKITLTFYDDDGEVYCVYNKVG